MANGLLGLFQVYNLINDDTMTKAISLFIWSIYNEAQKQVFHKQNFSIRDKTLPLNFYGTTAVHAYVGDVYESRSRSDLHILSRPGQYYIYSQEQLRDF